MEIQSAKKNILLINVYFPFYDHSNVLAQEREYSDTLGFIDFVINDNPENEIVLAADTNCNFYDNIASLSFYNLT